MNKYFSVILFCLMNVLISANVSAAETPPSNKATNPDPKAAAPVVSKAATTPIPNNVRVCTTCHGLYGKTSISPYPNLAGQNRDYLVYALKSYRDRDRNGGLANIMQQQAASLSEADINSIADYFSSLK
jgi:cytochrome c553